MVFGRVVSVGWRAEDAHERRTALLSPVHLSLKPISRSCSTYELSCAFSWPCAAHSPLGLRTYVESPLWAGFQLRPVTALLTDGRCAGRRTRAGQLPSQCASQGVMDGGRPGLHVVRLEGLRHVSTVVPSMTPRRQSEMVSRCMQDIVHKLYRRLSADRVSSKHATSAQNSAKALTR